MKRILSIFFLFSFFLFSCDNEDTPEIEETEETTVYAHGYTKSDFVGKYYKESSHGNCVIGSEIVHTFNPFEYDVYTQLLSNNEVVEKVLFGNTYTKNTWELTDYGFIYNLIYELDGTPRNTPHYYHHYLIEFSDTHMVAEVFDEFNDYTPENRLCDGEGINSQRLSNINTYKRGN